MQVSTTHQNQSVSESPPIFGFLTGGFAGMLPDVLASKARRDMWRCGYLHPQAYENYLAIRNFLFCAVVLVTVLWLVALQNDPYLSQVVLIVGGIASVLMYAIPRVYFSLLGKARAHRIVSSLPDGLDVLAMAMSGGLPLHRSLEHSVVELRLAHPDLADELALIGRQSGAGSLEYSLQRFAERVDMDESTSVVESLSQAVQLGSPLRSVLESLADRMRKERMQRATEKANKNTLKMLFPTVLCLVPAAFLIVMIPPLLKLKEFRVNSNQPGGALSQQSVSTSSSTPPRGNLNLSP